MVFVHLPAKKKCSTRPFYSGSRVWVEGHMTSDARNSWPRRYFCNGVPQIPSNKLGPAEVDESLGRRLLRPRSDQFNQQNVDRPQVLIHYFTKWGTDEFKFDEYWFRTF